MEKTDKLLPEPSTEGSELEDYHPCEVAKGAGGIFGSFGGGDGSTAPEPWINWRRWLVIGGAPIRWNKSLGRVFLRKEWHFCKIKKNLAFIL